MLTLAGYFSVARRTPREGVSICGKTGDGTRPSPEILQIIILLYSVKSECLILLAYAHAFLGNQQDASSDYQDTAYYVEDGSTDATGGRKEGTGFVDDVC